MGYSDSFVCDSCGQERGATEELKARIKELEELLEAAPLRAYNWAHRSWGTPEFNLTDCREALKR